MTFEEDLTKRRIDVTAFAAGEPNRFAEWQQMYAQMHPNSFYISVKMVLNDVRRKFWLAEAVKPAVAVTADAPAKPIARRATIPGAAKPAVSVPPAAEPTEQPESKPTPAAPARGRAVIRKPIASPEATNATDITPPAMPAVPAETSPATPAPRPRPVFRKPTPAVSSEEPTANQEQIAEDKTNHAAPFHTNPDPETEVPAPKPSRPRLVIKRPVPKSETENVSATVVPPVETKPESEMPTEVPTSANEPVKATPPRPRPVMRRPQPPAEENVPPALESAVKPAEEKPTAEPAAAAKPLRPRPVFKRPAKPEDNSEQ